MGPDKLMTSDQPVVTAKKDNSFWEKLAVAGVSGLATLKAAQAAPVAAVPQQQASPFLNAYISARKNALKSQMGG